MLAAIISGMVLSVACVLVHYEALRLLSCWAPRLYLPPRQRIVVVILGAYFGHVVEILLFASGFFALTHVFGLEATHPYEGGLPLDYALYYSAESFVSLGSSASFPQGPLRLFAGMEALVGLMLIGWSTSYTYLAMREFWDLH